MAATRILPGGAIVDGVSMAADITSDTLDVQGAGVVGLQFVAASATHVGTFAVELSVDGSTWDATGFQISAGTTATSVAASSGSAVAELVKVDVGQARHLRVTYTYTSGTGTAYVYAVRKRLSAPVTNGTATVTGTVTANAGTNLNTSALALDATLSAASAKLPASLGVKAAAASLSVTQSTEDAAVMAKLEARIAQPLLTAAPASISIGTSTASTTGLTVGTAYMVYASAPCFIKVGADAVTAATTDVYIEPGMVFVWTPTADNTDDGLACIGSVAGGKVYVQACQA